MQSFGLTVDKFLDHAAKWFAERGVTCADGARIRYPELRDRANRLSGALAALGLGFGDRIGTLAWNGRQHLELYYAAMGAGLVCHTLNPRLTAEHLARIIAEAEDRVLAVSADLLPLAQAAVAHCPSVTRLIVLDGESPASTGEGPPRMGFETLLAEHGAPAAWGTFDEQSAAGLCYTSGTTGQPKGVLYTHRSNYLHTLRALQADAVALTDRDAVLLAVPMFHANAWGLPFAAPAVGAELVLPGRDLDGASLARLMRAARVTVAVGVQTVWTGVIDYLDATGEDLPDLQRVLIGGSNCPDALLRRMEDRLGARVQTSWGMTELSPIGTIAPPHAPAAASGRPPMGIDLLLTDAEGTPLAQQRGIVGHLRVRGASVMDRYYRAGEDARDCDGWFDTGDLALIDASGNLTICGRSKDLIKSGGEWINPAEIEAIVGRDPAVGAVAVIGRPDGKWGERPVLVVEARRGETCDPQALLRALEGKVASWWIPDQVAQVPAMPLAATGKIDKNRLREDYASGRIATVQAARG